MRILRWFVAGAAGVWLLALVPGWLLGGPKAVLQSGVALLVCVVPAMGTLWWALRAGPTPEKQLLATLGGSGIRMLVVLAAGLVLHLGWPNTFDDYLWIWIAVFYIILLALETALLVMSKQRETLA